MASAAGASADVPVHHSWVAGQELPGRAGTRTAVNPATQQAFAEASLLDGEQAREAVGAAQAAFAAWSRTSFRERARLLDRLRQAVVDDADAIAALVEREQGKPAAEAYAVEILPSLEALRHLSRHAEELLRDEVLEGQLLLLAHKEARLVFAPIGVVLAITPWNYPWGLCLPIVAAALMAGDTVLLKPAPATTLVGLRIGALARKAGFPDGVVNVLAVDDQVAAALVEDPRLGKIVFTGSVATGKKVMAAAAKNLTPVVLELGGKDPAIVCRDADLDRAARGIVWGAFANAGQTCAAVERVYVERPVAEDFLARVVAETRLPAPRRPRRGRGRDRPDDARAAAADRRGARRGRGRQGRGRAERRRDAVGAGVLLSAHRARGRGPLDGDHARGDLRARCCRSWSSTRSTTRCASRTTAATASPPAAGRAATRPPGACSASFRPGS